MILVLGGSGYVGGAFLQLLSEKNIEHRSVARADVNYYDKSALAGLIKDSGAKFLINAAGYTGKPNVDACEIHKADCLTGNAVLPGVLREVCEDNSLPWGHVSSGCIYTGCREDGEGFTEEDAPNFSFRQNNCSFYSGCKALGEETLAGAENAYVWRLRIPFNHQDSPRNYLTKLLRYNRLLEATNSISHLNEFVAACFACWEKQIPAGTYNVTNTGWVTTRRWWTSSRSTCSRTRNSISSATRANSWTRRQRPRAPTAPWTIPNCATPASTFPTCTTPLRVRSRTGCRKRPPEQACRLDPVNPINKPHPDL